MLADLPDGVWFQENPDRLPGVPLDDVAIRVKLTTDPPIFEKPHHLGPREREFAREQVERWIKLGIYEEAKSPYGCNVTWACKRNTDELRMFINYRPVNDITEQDDYPLPRMEEVITFLTNATYITSIGVKWGCRNFSIHPDDRYKLAFGT